MSTVGSHISLFAGIGATDLAAERLGFRTVATAELDPWNRKVLEARFPEASHLSDVRLVRGDLWDDSLSRPLLVSGGFPCQDVSNTGFRAGLDGSRSGLWSEFARIIGELKPEYVLIENVAVLRNRGLDQILSDLHCLGYDARWDCLPAASVGAPHLRDRIYVACYRTRGVSRNVGVLGKAGDNLPSLPRSGTMTSGAIDSSIPSAPVKAVRQAALAGTLSAALPVVGIPSGMYPTPTRSDGAGGPGTTPKRTGGKNLRTVVNDLEGNGRLSPEFLEWMMGLPEGWTDTFRATSALSSHDNWVQPYSLPRSLGYNVKDRNKRVKALGNALVPSCAEVALRWIL